MSIKNLIDIKSKEQFQEYIANSNKTPVLVDFWAQWCGPCKALSPTLVQLAEKTTDKLIILKVNIDENPDLSSEHNVRSIPFLSVYSEGKKVMDQLGSKTLVQLEEWLGNLIK